MLHISSSPNYLPHQRNLNTAYRLIMQGDEEARAIVAAMDRGDKPPPSAFALLFAAMQKNKAFGGAVANVGGMLADLAKAPRTLAGVMQTLRANFDFLDSPAMQRCVAASDFSLSELKTSARGSSLYLCLPQRHMESHARWLRMMLHLIFSETEAVRGLPASGHRILMMLDEFPALKRMAILESSAAQIASHGIKMVFVAQTLAQLKDLYKDNWETLLGSAGTKLFFGNNDHFTREYVSKFVGEGEITRVTRNASRSEGQSSTSGRSTTNGQSTGTTSGESLGYSRGPGGSGSSFTRNQGGSQTWSHSESRSGSTTDNESRTLGYTESIHKRSLLTPDEVGRVFGDPDRPSVLVLRSGKQPLHLKRRPYYQIAAFAGHFDPHPHFPPPPTLKQWAMIRLEQQRVLERQRVEAQRRKDANWLSQALERHEYRDFQKRRAEWERNNARILYEIEQ